MRAKDEGHSVEARFGRTSGDSRRGRQVHHRRQDTDLCGPKLRTLGHITFFQLLGTEQWIFLPLKKWCAPPLRNAPGIHYAAKLPRVLQNGRQRQQVMVIALDRLMGGR